MNLKTILWDFDGVILDSMSVRDWGFRKIFDQFEANDVENLIRYHRENGGLSRYVKIRYFYENILKSTITEEEVLEYANRFSILMKEKLTNKENLIQDCTVFIKDNHSYYNFHIVSGSDQTELRFLCLELGISPYFISIHGSPTPKTNLVENLLLKYHYDKNETILIGDSMNDFEAASKNQIEFYGYNNLDLQSKGKGYIATFKDFREFVK